MYVYEIHIYNEIYMMQSGGMDISYNLFTLFQKNNIERMIKQVYLSGNLT